VPVPENWLYVIYAPGASFTITATGPLASVSPGAADTAFLACV